MNIVKPKQNRKLKFFKVSILVVSLAFGVSNLASAGLYQITFDDGHGDSGYGQIDVEAANNNCYASSGYLNVTAGGAAGDWILYTAGGCTPYPGSMVSPAGAYLYNNAVYPTAKNPQYPNSSVLLDDYGLLFTQSNGNELNLWGNPDGSYTLGGNVGGWQNFNVQISFGESSSSGGTSSLSIVPVPEPITLALPIFGGLLLTAEAARRLYSRLPSF
jgi:hypothetical protein